VTTANYNRSMPELFADVVKRGERYERDDARRLDS
jgi:hypothetical protein